MIFIFIFFKKWFSFTYWGYTSQRVSVGDAEGVMWDKLDDAIPKPEFVPSAFSFIFIFSLLHSLASHIHLHCFSFHHFDYGPTFCWRNLLLTKKIGIPFLWLYPCQCPDRWWRWWGTQWVLYYIEHIFVRSTTLENWDREIFCILGLFIWFYFQIGVSVFYTFIFYILYFFL